VESVAGPQVTGVLGLKAREGLRREAVWAGVETEAGEVPLQGALRGTAALGHADDDADLGGGASWHLGLEGLGELQQRLFGHRFALALDRRQCCEATGSVRPDPAVDGAAGDPDPLSPWSGVVTNGQLAHEHPTLAGAERAVGGFSDEGVAEERDLSLGVVHRSTSP
jgi:hypothetical protein